MNGACLLPGLPTVLSTQIHSLDSSFYAIASGAFVWRRLTAGFQSPGPCAPCTTLIMIIPYNVLSTRNVSLKGRDDASDGSSDGGNLSPQNQAIIGAVVGGVALIASKSRQTDQTRPDKTMLTR